MLLSVLALVVGLMLPLAMVSQQAQAADLPWTNTGGGLSTSNVRSLFYDPAHDVLYAGTENNGVWKYHDGTWVDMGGAMSSYGIMSLFYDAAHNVLYAGTGDPGYPCADGWGVWRYDGSGWSSTGGEVSGYYIQSLAYDPVYNLIYAAARYQGVWQYDGSTWTCLAEPDDTNSAYVWGVFSLAYDASRNLLYVGTHGNGVWQYDGSIWTKAGGPSGCYDVIDSLVYDSNHDVLYAAGGYSDGVWKYQGGTWANTGGVVGGYHVYSLAYDSARDLVYAGTVVYGSGGPRDNGAWQYDGSTWVSTGGVVAGCHIAALACDLSHDLVYAGIGGYEEEGQGVWCAVTYPVSSPVASGISPAAGQVGAEVTITGCRFGSSQGSSEVRFNGISASEYVSWSENQIKCKVPAGAATGLVTVVTFVVGTSNGVGFAVVSPNAPSDDSPVLADSPQNIVQGGEQQIVQGIEQQDVGGGREPSFWSSSMPVWGWAVIGVAVAAVGLTGVFLMLRRAVNK